MTIRSAILALNPSIYWPLDEVAGPTAFDVSGNGLNGQYQPNTSFELPGPEPGTHSIGAGTSAANIGVVRNGTPVSGFVAMSLVCWFAETLFNGTNNKNELMSNNPALGFGSLFNPFTGLPSWVFHGAAVFDTTFVVSAGAWHMLCCAWDTPAGGTSTYAVDLQAPQTLVGHTFTQILATSAVQILLPQGVSQVAHFALFNYALSNAQAQSIYNGAASLNTPSGTGRALTDFDLQSIKGELQEIRAAVIHAF